RYGRKIHLSPGVGNLHVYGAEHIVEALGRHERIVRLEVGRDQEERLARAVVLEEADGLAGDEALEVVRLFQFRHAADRHESWSSVVLANARPGIAELAPEVVDLRVARAGIALAELVGEDFGLRSEILEPVVEVEAVVEAVGLGVNEMHLADQAGHVAGASQIVGNGLPGEGQWEG